MTWPPRPRPYKINTLVWLRELGTRTSGPGAFTLDDVADGELQRLASHGWDAVWLMGVWERSPAAVTVARSDPGLRESYRKALQVRTLDQTIQMWS